MRIFHTVKRRGLYVSENIISQDMEDMKEDEARKVFSSTPQNNKERSLPTEEEIYGIDYLK